MELVMTCEELPDDKEELLQEGSPSQKVLGRLTEHDKTKSRSSRHNTNSKEIKLNRVLSKSSHRQTSLSEVEKHPLKIKKYESLREEARDKVDFELKAMKTMKQVKERKEQDISLDDDEGSKSLRGSEFQDVGGNNKVPANKQVVSPTKPKVPSPLGGVKDEPKYSEDDEYKDSHQVSQLRGVQEGQVPLGSLSVTPKAQSVIRKE